MRERELRLRTKIDALTDERDQALAALEATRAEVKIVRKALNGSLVPIADCAECVILRARLEHAIHEIASMGAKLKRRQQRKVPA
jgi:glutathione S-transferase